MSAPWKTTIGVWLDNTLTTLIGSGWQYHVRKALGLYAGELRPLLDCDLDERAIQGMEGMISRYLCERADKLQQQADEAAAAADAFEAAAKKRRFDVELAEKCRDREEIDVLFELICQQSLVDIERAKEAARC